ncbi:hypothetical protein AVEN_224163-1 [Araneus ventricosus]|uniref:Uncharacterized protein n=1 Tax=Araneus ventricosus TaxID=182803 RepID=A0A4Y2DNA5_ARAVE|nr:hypothetical protein AVEN_224163-1 [Araneus ventricosus]
MHDISISDIRAPFGRLNRGSIISQLSCKLTLYSMFCVKRRSIVKKIQYALEGRGGLVEKSRLWGRRAPCSKPDSTEDPPCMRPAARQIIRSGQTPSRWRGAEAWRGGASSSVVI